MMTAITQSRLHLYKKSHHETMQIVKIGISTTKYNQNIYFILILIQN